MHNGLGRGFEGLVRSVEPVPEGEPAIVGVKVQVVEVVEICRVDEWQVVAGVFAELRQRQPDEPRNPVSESKLPFDGYHSVTKSRQRAQEVA